MGSVLCISSDEVSGLATPAEYVTAVRDGYRQRGEGAPVSRRTTLRRETPSGKLTGYSAILPESEAMGGYMYASGFSRGDAWFVTPLFDSTTGDLLALIDGSSLNPLKTSAAGAVGADALSRDDADTLTVFGSGPQAKAQLRAIATVRDLNEVVVYSPTEEHREAFVEQMSRYVACDIVAASSSEDAIRNTDIIVTATRAVEPVFDGSALPDGTHVTAMGQYHPEKRELDVLTVKRALYVPDLRERPLEESGAFLAALRGGHVTEDHVYAELGEVVAGLHPGRRSPSDVTVFDSGGTGIETVAAARLVYEKALERGFGTEVDFGPASETLTGLD